MDMEDKKKEKEKRMNKTQALNELTALKEELKKLESVSVLTIKRRMKEIEKFLNECEEKQNYFVPEKNKIYVDRWFCTTWEGSATDYISVGLGTASSTDLALIRLRHRMEIKGRIKEISNRFPVDWSDGNQRKCYFWYDTQNNFIRNDYTYYCYKEGVVFGGEGFWEAVKAEIPEADLILYLKGDLDD
jgi:hypothetical protein